MNYTELKRLADELIAANDLFNESPQDNEVGDAWSLANDHFTDAASPEVILALIAENEQLKIDNGSLRGSTKRMGEDVSKMQKQLRKAGRDIDQLKKENDRIGCLLEIKKIDAKTYRQASERFQAENEALRKHIEDLSPFKGAPLSGPNTRCLACGGYHYGLGGLPCPKMKITAQVELTEFRSGQIGAALFKGEQP